MNKTPSFTLIELLVVISIITLIASVIFASINKSRIAARDTRRISDLQEFRKAILLASDSNLSLGSASTVYTSLSDSSQTCASYTLPGLPAGWHYHCSPNPTKNDGTGWLPIPFSQTSPPVLSILSIDPLNTGTPSAPFYYTYVYDPSTQNWNLNATMENPAQGVGTIAAKDGGISMVKYELGTDPTYGPSVNNGLPASFSQGLIGYWPLDEGGGAIAYDVSGGGNNGTLMYGASWGVGKVGGGAIQNTTSSQGFGVSANNSVFNTANNSALTLALWMKPDAYPLSYASFILVDKGNSLYGQEYALHFQGPSHGVRFIVKTDQGGSNPPYGTTLDAGSNFPLNQWKYIVVTISKIISPPTTQVKVYLNGLPAVSRTINDIYTLTTTRTLSIGTNFAGGGFIGTMDDVRVYNRALSDAEVLQLYNAEK